MKGIAKASVVISIFIVGLGYTLAVINIIAVNKIRRLQKLV